MRRRRLLRITWLIALGCVVAGSLAPSDSAVKRAMDDLNVSDKLWHVLAYFVLMLLPALHEKRLALTLQAVGIVALSFALEFAGQFVGRSLDGGDMVANVAGVLAGLIAGAWLRAERVPWAAEEANDGRCVKPVQTKGA